MNGRIVIDVTLVGKPPDDTYHFGIQHPDDVTLDEVASVLNIVVRNLRKRATETRPPLHERMAGDLRVLRDTTPCMPDADA